MESNISLDTAIQFVSPFTQYLRLTGICVEGEIEIESSLSPEATFSAISAVFGTRANFDPESPPSQNMEKEMPSVWPTIRSLPDIRHIRLEQVRLDELRSSDFDVAGFAELRALMLYPWTYSSVPDAHHMLPLKGSEEYRLLKEILYSAPARLRVVFVGIYHVWILPEQHNHCDLQLQVMPLAEARADNEQFEVMKRELTHDDWYFKNDIPPESVQDLSLEAIDRDAGMWEPQFEVNIRERSYLILKRKDQAIL